MAMMRNKVSIRVSIKVKGRFSVIITRVMLQCWDPLICNKTTGTGQKLLIGLDKRLLFHGT